MNKIKTVIATFVTATLMAIAAIAQAQPEAKKTPAQPNAQDILKKVSNKLVKAESYQFEGQTSFEMKSEGIQIKVDLPFVIAQNKEGKYKIEMRIPILGKIQMVCDGKNEWMYFDFDKEYSKKPFVKNEGTESLAQIASALQMFGLPLADATGTNTNSDVKTANILREETVNVNGNDVACYVIEVEYDLSKNPLAGVADALMESKPGEAEADAKLQKLQKAFKEGTSKMTMWIDKENAVIVRHQSTGGLLGNLLGAFGNGTEANILTDMQIVKLNETLPESLFIFTPPADAKEKVEKAPATEEPDHTNLVGSPAPEFALKDLSGKTVSSTSLRGKVVVLDFWASWCGPCRETMPEIEKLHRDFKDKGLVVLGVNDEEAETARGFIQKNGFTFSTVVDEGSGLSDQFGVTAIPQTLIIDRDGKVFAHFFGTGEGDNLREAIKVALATNAENSAKPVKKIAPTRPARVTAKTRR